MLSHGPGLGWTARRCESVAFAGGKALRPSLRLIVEKVHDMTDQLETTLPVRSGAPLIPRDIVRGLALDIGKEVAAHIETMYPKAVEATSPNMLLSVRNCVFNQIMAALDVIDEDEIRARLEKRRKFRRKLRAAYRNLREPVHAG